MNTDALIEEPIEKYHRHPALSASGMKLLLQSPLHYKSRYIDGVALDPSEEEELSIVEEPTDAQRFGQLFHTWILEPEKRTTFVEEKKFSGTGMKERKQWWLAELPPGAVVVKPDWLERFAGMEKSLANHEYAAHLLTGGINERSIYFETQTVDGLVTKCRARPDKILPYRAGGPVDVIELKTALRADYDSFCREVENRKYYMQAAVQWDALVRGAGAEVKFHYWVVVEKYPPFPVSVYPITDELLDDGRKEYGRACGVYQHALSIGRWNSYNDGKPRDMGRVPWKVYG